MSERTKEKQVYVFMLPQKNKQGETISEFPVALNPLGALEALAEIGEFPPVTLDYLEENDFFTGAAGQGALINTIAAVEALKTPSIRELLKSGDVDFGEYGSILDTISNVGTKIASFFSPMKNVSDKFMDATGVLQTSGEKKVQSMLKQRREAERAKITKKRIAAA